MDGCWWISGCGKNTSREYAAVFSPAAGFQARGSLVVKNGRWWMVDGGWWVPKGSLILLKFLSDELHSTNICHIWIIYEKLVLSEKNPCSSFKIGRIF